MQGILIVGMLVDVQIALLSSVSKTHHMRQTVQG